ncbi:hypothetical protein TESG_00032 [Trichophyton tonsurans CBS 112818]|uniref:Uncharacterized protein n=1 Tax=Trichophyton tonsurans (strain CBS 112818) TaxID=647933 RepID=F2RMA7_TRIT1|nr:hypothetical protein TESG_00032 [Trichophyton tonsurans CBS 112818]
MATVATEKRWMGGLLTARAKLAVDKQQTNNRTGWPTCLSSRTLISPSCAFSPVSPVGMGWDACLTKWAGGSVFSRTEQGSAARGPCAGWAALLCPIDAFQREVGKDPWSLIPGGATNSWPVEAISRAHHYGDAGE